MRFKITFKFGVATVAVIYSPRNSASDLKVSELEKILDTEKFLERLTGLRVHIEEVR